MRIAPTTDGDWLARRAQPYARTQEWTQEEKDLVLARLSGGRKPLLEITRALNGTKSLRQVTEYIEHLEFWSRVLEKPAGDPEPPKAKESSERQVEAEEVEAARVCKASDAKAKAKAKAPHPSRRRSRLIDEQYVHRLTQRLRRNKSARPGRHMVQCLDRSLREFVQQVLFRVSVDAELALPCATRVRKRHISAALRSCGFVRGDAAAPGNQ